ncbi:MAG: ATP-binding protein [Bacilli bacterium]|nr:ATP-binding protein [Bacilli bacterium]
MSAFTFLKESQAAGVNKIEIFNKITSKAAISDFAILLGGNVSETYHSYQGNNLYNRTGSYWLIGIEINKEVRVIHESGFSDLTSSENNKVGVRPIFKYNSKMKLSYSSDEVKEFNFGEYPQVIASDDVSRQLEDIYKSKELGKVSKTLFKTGRGYTISDSERLEEYEYEGKYYVRVISKNDCLLSNGKKATKGKAYWIEVKPILWIIDGDLAICKNIIASGMNYHYAKDKFINKYLASEMTGRRITMPKINNDGTHIARKKNPYGFILDEVSEEDIIKKAIESDVPVFLHGRSSEGKSARVKDIDPDCIILYLRNATPDSLNGKSVYNANTGNMIDLPPTWYKKLVEKCEAEPDKLHILFFDELTNALPSIQGMAFNIILDKEVNGLWKLPNNCRVVAAGNELKDSLAANLMAEPLFNRFAHVYIETTVDKWLIWAKEHNIHPAIQAFITYKSYLGDEVLRSEFNGVKPNADPRKWEMASKVLRETQSVGALRSLIGEDICKDFMEFCRQEVITVNDVISKNYTNEDLKMNVSEKFATAVGLSSVSEGNVKVVRDFVSLLGKEVLAMFDTLWVGNDNKRMELIAGFKLEENNKKGR